MATKKPKLRVVKSKTPSRRKANGSTLSKGSVTASDLADNTVADAMRCLKSVEEWLEEKQKVKMAAARKCKDANIEISGAYATAKERGVNTRAVKTLVKTRMLDRARGKLVEDLDADVQDLYEAYARKAGSWEDTPLGDVAVGKNTDGEDLGAPAQ